MKRLYLILLILGLTLTYTLYQVNQNTDDILNLQAQLDGLTTYNNTVTKTLSGSVRENLVALCDPGDVVTGGGASVIPEDSGFSLVDRKPLANLTGYDVLVYSNSHVPKIFTAYAICLDITP